VREDHTIDAPSSNALRRSKAAGDEIATAYAHGAATQNQSLRPGAPAH